MVSVLPNYRLKACFRTFGVLVLSLFLFWAQFLGVYHGLAHAGIAQSAHVHEASIFESMVEHHHFESTLHTSGQGQRTDHQDCQLFDGLTAAFFLASSFFSVGFLRFAFSRLRGHAFVSVESFSHWRYLTRAPPFILL